MRVARNFYYTAAKDADFLSVRQEVGPSILGTDLFGKNNESAADRMKYPKYLDRNVKANELRSLLKRRIQVEVINVLYISRRSYHIFTNNSGKLNQVLK